LPFDNQDHQSFHKDSRDRSQYQFSAWISPGKLTMTPFSGWGAGYWIEHYKSLPAVKMSVRSTTIK
jgi:hypothetical protein